jgi:hypothetical protein
MYTRKIWKKFFRLFQIGEGYLNVNKVGIVACRYYRVTMNVDMTFGNIVGSSYKTNKIP